MVWSFELDHIHDFGYCDEFLSEKECNEIVKIGKSIKILNG